MRPRLGLLVIPVVVALVALVCSLEGLVGPVVRIDLPEPVKEPSPLIPDNERTYYKLHPYASASRMLMEWSVDSVLAAHGRLLHAWIPVRATPCMDYGAMTVIIIEAEKPYDGLMDLGWVESPEDWWIVNCGVDSCWHYEFDLPR